MEALPCITEERISVPLEIGEEKGFLRLAISHL
jgi:hypothetical protein